jgi:hypothetical protein
MGRINRDTSGFSQNLNNIDKLVYTVEVRRDFWQVECQSCLIIYINKAYSY